MEETLDISRLFMALKRRWFVIAAISVFFSAIAVLTAFLLPPVYESSAKILVESQQIPDQLARSTVTSETAERLQLIEQRLMTRQNLLEVIERLNLFQDEPDLTPAQQVEQIRRNTTIKSIGNPRQRRRDVSVSAFTITYRSQYPRRAALVANEFVTMILEQNIRARSERASETHDFFRREVEQLSQDLGSLEVQISDFKRANESALPESLAFRRNELNSLQENHFDLERKIITLEEEKRSLERSLELSLDLLSQPETQLSSAERQLAELQNRLTAQRGIYAETHPAVRALKAQIAALENTIEPQVASDADAPSRTQMITKSRQVEAERQIELISKQLSLLEQQRRASLERQAKLEESITLTPRVEMELNALERLRAQLKHQFDSAVLKQTEAATGEKLEVNRQAERFEVIEQAEVPEAPVAPRRRLIAAGGVGLSVAMGLAFVLLLELLNQSVRTPADLERRLNLRPIVSIPYIETASEMRRRRWMTRSAIIFLAVFVPASLFAIDRYYLPLPVIAEKVVERSGLDRIIRVIEERLL